MGTPMTATFADDGLGAQQRDAPASTLEDAVSDALRKGGPREAVTLLVHHCGESVHRYCCQLIGDKTTADDVYQQIFAEAYRDLADFSGQSVRSWLFAIAHNRCMDELRRHHRNQSRLTLCESLPDVLDNSPNTDEAVELHEFTDALDECITCLRPEARIAVILRYQEGFTYNEMERICRERASTLHARVTRAVATLRQCLKEKGVL
jgi:RNA polymerase sigma-70 factor (ECF subfamily)